MTNLAIQSCNRVAWCDIVLDEGVYVGVKYVLYQWCFEIVRDMLASDLRVKGESRTPPSSTLEGQMRCT
jgi:hypothetical protein